MIETADRDYIEGILFHPSVWPWWQDDDAPDWRPPIGPNVIWLRPEEGGALFMIYPHFPRLWEAHSAVLPEYRTNTTRYYREGIQWVRDNTICTHLVGMIPTGNPRASAAVRAAGFKQEGLFTKAKMQRGKLRDIAVYGLEI